MAILTPITNLFFKKKWLRLSVGVALFFYFGAYFANAADIEQRAEATNLVTLNMRDADIRALIQWIAEQTHKQIVIDPRVQGRVTAFADRPMTIAQAYQVFLALLEVHGFSSSDTDGIVRIYPSALARISPKAVVDDFNNIGSDSGQVMHVAEIKNVSAAALTELIKPLLGAGGYIAPLPKSNSLVIADSSDNLKRLLELIQRMDSSGSLDIDVVKLQHANARDVAQVLASLVKPGGNAPGAQSNGLSIAADERSNSVLLAGDPLDRQRAKQLLVQLDQPLAATAASRVIFLHYLSAEEILPILKSATNSAQKEAKDQTLKQASISIEASKSNNAIVMNGPPDLLDNMQDIITKLDIQRSQVLVEAVIVEIDKELADKLGVEWNTDFQSNGLQAASNFGLRAQAASASGSNSSTNVLSLISSGLTLGYYQGGSIRALLNALSSNSAANILSTPSVMTLENQQAQIVVGSNIPIITGQATGTTASTANPFTTYERKDIGVTLKITPQINDGKSVTLDIVQEVQTVADTTGNSALAAAKDIVTNKRSISTKVIVKDDTTLVLGGLISDQNQQSVDKVPILGDMPLVGRLFRSTSNKNTKQNLMVFIHPVIINSKEVADDISRNDYEKLRVQQLKYRDGKLEEAAPSAALPEFESISPQRKASENSLEDNTAKK